MPVNPTIPPLTRPMDEMSEARLCRLFNVAEASQLPEEVRMSYEYFRHIDSKLTLNSMGTPAFLFAVLEKACVPVPMPQPSFWEHVRAGLVEMDTPVLVKLKANKWEPAKYLGASAGMVVVDMAGTERRIDPELVAFAEETASA